MAYDGPKHERKRDEKGRTAWAQVGALRTAAHHGLPVAQCSAKAKVSGNRCKNPAILGGSVCPFHGGNAPQVREAARTRILELVPDAVEAMAKLAGLVDGMGAEKEEVRQRAAADILDRAGLRSVTEISVSEQAAPNDVLDAAIAAAMKARKMLPELPDGIEDAEIVEES